MGWLDVRFLAQLSHDVAQTQHPVDETPSRASLAPDGTLHMACTPCLSIVAMHVLMAVG